MKKLQLASLIVLWSSLLLLAAGRLFSFLPDWAVRINGVIMLTATGLLVFSSVRLNLKGR